MICWCKLLLQLFVHKFMTKSVEVNKSKKKRNSILIMKYSQKSINFYYTCTEELIAEKVVSQCSFSPNCWGYRWCGSPYTQPWLPIRPTVDFICMEWKWFWVQVILWLYINKQTMTVAKKWRTVEDGLPMRLLKLTGRAALFCYLIDKIREHPVLWNHSSQFLVFFILQKL